MSLFSPTPPRIESTATTFTRGTDALKTLRERRDDFDIVLSDVHMPDMDGFKLLEAVALELDVPVMMMSANSATEVVLRGIIHGAVDYLLKPVRIEEIRNIWQHVVRRRRDDGTVQDLLDPQSSGGRGAASEGSQGSKDAGERGGAGKKGNSSAKGASAKKRGADALAANDSGETNSGSGKARNGKGGKNQGADGDEGNGKGADGGAGPQNGSGGRGEHEDSSALKKPRVVWSAELHQQFVTAVNQLGIDKAVPKRILDLMGVQGLTRENVASHLQKYRLYLKRLQGVSAHAAGVGGNPGFMTGLTIDGAGNVMGPPGGRIGSPALGGPASGSPTHAMGMPGMAGGGAPVGGMPHGAGGLSYRMAPPPLGVPGPGGKMQGGAPNGGVHPHGQPYVIAHGQVGAANGAPVMMQGGMGPGPGGMGPGPGGVMQMRAGGADDGADAGGRVPRRRGDGARGAHARAGRDDAHAAGLGVGDPAGDDDGGAGRGAGGEPREDVPGGGAGRTRMGPGPGGDALGDEVLDMVLKDGLPEGEF